MTIMVFCEGGEIIPCLRQLGIQGAQRRQGEGMEIDQKGGVDISYRSRSLAGIAQLDLLRKLRQ